MYKAFIILFIGIVLISSCTKKDSGGAAATSTPAGTTSGCQLSKVTIFNAFTGAEYEVSYNYDSKRILFSLNVEVNNIPFQTLKFSYNNGKLISIDGTYGKDFYNSEVMIIRDSTDSATILYSYQYNSMKQIIKVFKDEFNHSTHNKMTDCLTYDSRGNVISVVTLDSNNILVRSDSMQYDNHKNPVAVNMVVSFLANHNMYSYFGPNNCIYEGGSMSRKYTYNSNDYPATEHDSTFSGTERISDYRFFYDCQ